MPEGEPVDFDRLEGFMRALSYSSRLELLSLLRTPRTLPDIHLAPRQVRAGENPERPVARQTLQGHLEKLVEIGVVSSRDATDPRRRGKEYVMNPQRMYQVMEELRKVATLGPGAAIEREDTLDLADPRARPLEPGPKLMLVHGLTEGKVFPLRRADLKGERGWVIGRKPGLQVSLEYDPYVSVENAEVLPQPGRLVLLDLRSSKNGTLLNWRRMEKDTPVALTPGDVIGVGRSALVYRAE